jgi:hypothetical protein
MCSMLATSDNSQEIGRLVAATEAFAAATPDERARLIAQWREHVQEGQAGLERQAATFDDIYRDAVQRNLALSDILDLAAATLEEQQQAAAHIRLAEEILLRQAADVNDPELSSIIGQGLEIVRRTLESFDLLRDRLLALAEERRGLHEILRARPLVGDIDHEALTREIVERFPKILAALAK